MSLRPSSLAFGRTPAQRSLNLGLKPGVTQRLVAVGRLSDLCHSRVVLRRLAQRSIRLATVPMVSTEM
jgi:hypothetical protein